MEGTLVADAEKDLLVTDLLVNMFMKQMDHKRAYDEIYKSKGLNPVGPEDYGNLDDPAVQAEIRTTIGYFLQELFEATDLLKNKPWKQTEKHTDPGDFYSELADAWHFWLELMILCGMGPDRIQSYYFKEAAKNDARRQNGY